MLSVANNDMSSSNVKSSVNKFMKHEIGKSSKFSSKVDTGTMARSTLNAWSSRL